MLKIYRTFIFFNFIFFMADISFIEAKMKNREVLVPEEYLLKNTLPVLELSDDYPTYMPLNCTQHPNICLHIDLFIDANSSYSMVNQYKVPFLKESINRGASDAGERNSGKQILFSDISIGKKSEKEFFKLLNKTGKEMGSLEDYNDFNPKIKISKGFTNGERERIKRSLMLIKMVLNSKQYYDLINSSRVFDGIYNFDFKVLQEDYRPGPKDILFYSEPKAEDHPNIFNSGKKVYESLLALSQEQMTFFIEKGNGAYHSLANSLYSVDGNHRIYLNYNAKVASYGQDRDVLPTVLLHQIMHILFRIKAHSEGAVFDYDKKDSWDPISIFCDILFRYVFLNVEFPKVPQQCYRGETDDIC